LSLFTENNGNKTVEHAMDAFNFRIKDKT